MAYFANQYTQPIGALGAYFANQYTQPISGLGASPDGLGACAPCMAGAAFGAAEVPPRISAGPEVFVPGVPTPAWLLPAAPPTLGAQVWQGAKLLAGAACAYHGYVRNQSPGWAVGWSIFGSAAPLLALPIALAQGFAMPKRR